MLLYPLSVAMDPSRGFLKYFYKSLYILTYWANFSFASSLSRLAFYNRLFNKSTSLTRLYSNEAKVCFCWAMNLSSLALRFDDKVYIYFEWLLCYLLRVSSRILLFFWRAAIYNLKIFYWSPAWEALRLNLSLNSYLSVYNYLFLFVKLAIYSLALALYSAKALL